MHRRGNQDISIVLVGSYWLEQIESCSCQMSSMEETVYPWASSVVNSSLFSSISLQVYWLLSSPEVTSTQLFASSKPSGKEVGSCNQRANKVLKSESGIRGTTSSEPRALVKRVMTSEALFGLALLMTSHCLFVSI